MRELCGSRAGAFDTNDESQDFRLGFFRKMAIYLFELLFQFLLSPGLRISKRDGSIIDGFKIRHFSFKKFDLNFFLAPNNVQQNGKLYS